MEPVFFREGQHYSFANLQKEFSLDKENTNNRINLLKRFNILKTVRKNKPEFSELSDQDIVIGDVPEDSSEYAFQFTYVGVILLDNIVVLCYPKYIDNDEKSFEKLKTIFKVLEKYNQKEQVVHLYNGEAESKQFNQLAISLHILADYYENGLYSNQQEVIELNGDGEILWDKTINETFAYIKNNKPYYLEYYTHDNTDNDLDYIRRLHAAIVTKCSKDLSQGNLLELFALEGAELTDQTLEDFGDSDYIQYRLEQEIKNQFITRKQSLLKTIYTYIAEKQANENEDCFGLYGTNSFNLVWETACGELFNNYAKKTYAIKELKEKKLIDGNSINKDDLNNKISYYIDLPDWKINNESVLYEGDLIPDIISFRKIDSSNTGMYILDGKYYLLTKSGEKLKGNPGIQDVIKQYIYNAALRSFIHKFKIAAVANAFLVPALEKDTGIIQTDEEIDKIGTVSYWTVQSSGFKELPEVQVIRINPDLVWEHYLKGYSLSESDKIWERISITPTRNYLYHNADDKYPVIDNDNIKHILVGFLKPDYFEYAKKRKTIIYYFYATNSDHRFPLHPYIDLCTSFIGFTKDRKRFIKGDLELLPNGRCKIDEIIATDLINLLKDEPYNYDKKTSNANTYYKMVVKNIVESDCPYENIPDYDLLQMLINKNGLNDVLYETSPKVIDLGINGTRK